MALLKNTIRILKSVNAEIADEIEKRIMTVCEMYVQKSLNTKQFLEEIKTLGTIHEFHEKNRVAYADELMLISDNDIEEEEEKNEV